MLRRGTWNKDFRSSPFTLYGAAQCKLGKISHRLQTQLLIVMRHSEISSRFDHVNSPQGWEARLCHLFMFWKQNGCRQRRWDHLTPALPCSTTDICHKESWLLLIFPKSSSKSKQITADYIWSHSDGKTSRQSWHTNLHAKATENKNWVRVLKSQWAALPVASPSSQFTPW